MQPKLKKSKNNSLFFNRKRSRGVIRGNVFFFFFEGWVFIAFIIAAGTQLRENISNSLNFFL